MSRTEAAEGQAFSGVHIDRKLPITFTVDGTRVSGFAGDTVLSALLAAGWTSAGTHLGWPLALTDSFAPLVYHRLRGGGLSGGLPPALTLVRNGDEFLSAPRAKGLGLRGIRRLLRHEPLGLDVGWDDLAVRPYPFSEADKPHDAETDIVIVGAGVSGMAAALCAARLGRRALLVERRMYAGGEAELFGAQEGEQPPARAVDEMWREVVAAPGIEVMLGTEAIDLGGGKAVLRRVSYDANGARTMLIGCRYRVAILASGCADRLPLFPGNRLAGMMGVSAAFHLAHGYGAWAAGHTIIAGGTSTIYRLGMMATDAGRPPARLLDFRLDPRSRFRDFAKAYGIQQSSGMLMSRVSRPKRSGQLHLDLTSTWDDGGLVSEQWIADRIIASDGWSPRLGLWHRAGGRLRWRQDALNFEAQGDIEGLAIAGSAAGYRSLSACRESGNAAASRLLGAPHSAVSEVMISEMFESADHAPQAHSGGPADPPAYLAGGLSMVRARVMQDPKARKRSRIGKQLPEQSFATWLELGDVASMVVLGEVSAADAPDVAAERVVAPIEVRASPVLVARAPTADATTVPAAFLSGRFAGRISTCIVAADDGRRMEPGCLIFMASHQRDPFEAVGVCCSTDDAGAVAVIEQRYAREGQRIVVRDGSRTIPAVVARCTGSA